MENFQEIYNARSQLLTFVSTKVDKGINVYLNKHKNDIRYFLHYPLVNIELGLDDEPAESIENGIRRDIFGFLISRTFSLWNALEHKNKVNDKGYLAMAYCYSYPNVRQERK